MKVRTENVPHGKLIIFKTNKGVPVARVRVMESDSLGSVAGKLRWIASELEELHNKANRTLWEKILQLWK